jgi:opacity protein-like surface antigen
MSRWDYQDEERRAMQMLAGSVVATLLALAVGMALAFVSDASAETYVTLQAGGSRLTGPGTETSIDVDVNPRGHPYHISNGVGFQRIAVGHQKGQLALEFGVTPRLGGYHRSLEYGDDDSGDSVGEVVDVGLVDLRLSLHTKATYGLSAYGYLGLGAAFYKREVWEGHQFVAGVQSYKGGDAEGWWRITDGVEPSYGLGAGVEWQFSQRWSLTAEYGATFGEFKTQAVSGGIKFNF